MIRTFGSIADYCFHEFQDNNLLFDTTRGKFFSYREGFDFIRKTSEQLSLQGIQKGKMVLTYTPLAAESVMLCWSCLYNGIVFVPVDHNWPKEILAQIIKEVNPEIILTDPERLEHVKEFSPQAGILLTGDRKVSNEFPLFFDWMNNVVLHDTLIIPGTQQDDLAVILYTSGSTGTPKGVMLSQKALYNSGLLIATHYNWTREHLFLNLGDLHSMSGLRNTCLSPLYQGSSFVVASHEERGNILSVIDLVNKLRINFIGVAPTVVRQLNILFSASRRQQLNSLRAILCTGGPLASDQLEFFFQQYKIPVFNYYGLTETAGICSGHNTGTFNPGDNSIGPPVGADLTISKDPEYENENDCGELVVRSDNLMMGYFQKPEETAMVLKNGCFFTGDIARKREDGCFELLGRKRNIIKTITSELIHLEEIEIAIESYPFITEACTCSFTRFEEDEKLVAFIVFKQDNNMIAEDQISNLKTYLYDKVGKSRAPACFYIEEKLPRSTSGKIQRHLLKEKLNEYHLSQRKRYF